jgi:hypothetical protein
VLDVHVTLRGDKVAITGLQGMATRMPGAIKRGLNRIAIGVHRETVAWLSGAAGRPGGYPVPVRTGHLRRMQAWLKPGETKTGEAGTFTAGPMEVVVYNSAGYATMIHEGKGRNARHGARPFLTDALTRFNSGARIVKIMEEEIAAEIART